MKTYIPGETKAQRKARKALEKEGLTPLAEPTTEFQEDSTKRYVVCLKHGNKYGADYVNNLYNMVQRNLTIPHEFVCFTEDSTGIDENISIKPLPILPISGWWYKPLFFNPQLELKGTILFLDLDVIVFRNIDKLFTYKPGEFCIIRDFNRYMIKNYQKFNSSVFRLTTGQHSNVYYDFIKNPNSLSRRYHGDQDWIRKAITNNFSYWPDEWIQSYKWEMRGKPQFDKQPRGKRDFLVNGDPVIKNDTSIAVFHGEPNPHICKDPWVMENWK